MSIDIVMLIFPYEVFLIYGNSIIKLAWTQAFQHFTLENCVFLPCFHILSRFVVFDIFDRPDWVFVVLERG